jgi:hypothetical protein
MNIKTKETNQQVIKRMENGFVNNIENEKKNVESGITKEERKLILNKINKVVSYKNTTGEDIINYVDQISTGLKMLAA